MYRESPFKNNTNSRIELARWNYLSPPTPASLVLLILLLLLLYSLFAQDGGTLIPFSRTQFHCDV